jgi:hypothetical protein
MIKITGYETSPKLRSVPGVEEHGVRDACGNGTGTATEGNTELTAAYIEDGICFCERKYSSPCAYPLAIVNADSALHAKSTRVRFPLQSGNFLR